MTVTVAIIGRPNVGKSTLFNRLVGMRIAIVEDTPGVTRDRREGEARIGDLSFRIFDTAGLEGEADASLAGRMRAQTNQAVAEADMVWMLVDGRQGLLPDDHLFAQWLRTLTIPVFILVNKCEGQAGMAGLAEAYSLGLGEPIPISAAHGEGIADLVPLITALAPQNDALDDEAAADAPLRLAVLGRPNAGKSTLINHLIGEERLVTGPEPGITRDAITIPWQYRDQPVQLLDTAGLRRRARVQQPLEKMTNRDAMWALQLAQLVVLLVDATQPLERQDLTIARRAIDEGRALLIGLNKWDLIADTKATLQRVQARLEDSLPQVKGVPFVPLSALTGAGIDKLMPTALRLMQRWERRISTADVNQCLSELVAQHPPPLGPAKRRIKLRYATQARTRPPTFVLFVNQKDALPDAYIQYLRNGFREIFDLDGVPIRFHMRTGNNPYASKAKR